jgi:GrpB-like predicted nucleotidyltransferase (UPF0157 family)
MLLIAVDAGNEPIGVVGYRCAVYQAKGSLRRHLTKSTRVSSVSRSDMSDRRPSETSRQRRIRACASMWWFHLYLVVAGSVAHRDHIDFRDFLRNHPDDAPRYGQLNVEFSCYLATDRDRYIDGKRSLIEDILHRAR